MSTSAILRNSLNFNLLYTALYGTLQPEAILLKETIYHLHAPIHTNITLLTDLHNRPYQSIIDSLTVHRPDMICIAGDLIYSITPIGDTPVIQRESNVLPFLVACRKLAPTFVSLGNHEWMLSDADFQIIRSTGVTLLDNSWCSWNGLVIGGLSSAQVTDYQRSLR